MKKGKPIEPGCLAMIVGAKHCTENNGKVVRVVRDVTGMRESLVRPPQADIAARALRVRIAENPFFNPADRRWMVAPLRGSLMWATENYEIVVHVGERAYRECYLIRLDDDEEPKQETRVTETHKPKTEEVF